MVKNGFKYLMSQLEKDPKYMPNDEEVRLALHNLSTSEKGPENFGKMIRPLAYNHLRINLDNCYDNVGEAFNSVCNDLRVLSREADENFTKNNQISSFVDQSLNEFIKKN